MVIFSQRLKDRIAEIEASEDLDYLDEAVDGSCTAGYDNDGSIGPDLFENGIALGLEAAHYGEDAEIFYANDVNDETRYFVIGLNEDDAISRINKELKVARESLEAYEKRTGGLDGTSEDPSDACCDALARFGDWLEYLATHHNEAGHKPEHFSDNDEFSQGYYCAETKAFLYSGYQEWDEFLGSVAYKDGKWVAEWQEHK